MLTDKELDRLAFWRWLYLTGQVSEWTLASVGQSGQKQNFANDPERQRFLAAMGGRR